MAKHYHSPIRFSTVLGRRIEGDFSGGHVTGNAGIQLLSEVDRDAALAIHRELFEQFVAAHPVAPRRLVPGFAASRLLMTGRKLPVIAVGPMTAPAPALHQAAHSQAERSDTCTSYRRRASGLIGLRWRREHFDEATIRTLGSIPE